MKEVTRGLRERNMGTYINNIIQYKILCANKNDPVVIVQSPVVSDSQRDKRFKSVLNYNK